MDTLNFWDFDSWGTINLVGVVLIALLIANILKKNIGFIKKSLIPTSVLAGLMLLTISNAYHTIVGKSLFETELFSNRGLSGISILEIITYHTLALGFIAQALKKSSNKFTGQRAKDIFNSGVTTVSTYLLQGVFGLGITMLFALIVTDFFPAAGVLLPFGYGQGSGQALNYGNIYETEYGFVGGKSFGLSIAALGFLSASLGGIIYLHILKRKGRLANIDKNASLNANSLEANSEKQMNGTMDRLTVQIAFVVGIYMLTYAIMYVLGTLLLPSMQSVIYGFNFLFGVIMASLVKVIINLLQNKNVIKTRYTNNFLLTRISNFCFDIMIVTGIAAIELDALKNYWHILLFLGVVGLVITFIYNKIVVKALFKDYEDQQFLAMYGMLTGTASTGIMLLREIDPDYTTPANENLVFQTLPAIVFGFPMMLLATLAPKDPSLTLILLTVFFVVMNVILFRSFIFRRRKKKTDA